MGYHTIPLRYHTFVTAASVRFGLWTVGLAMVISAQMCCIGCFLPGQLGLIVVLLSLSLLNGFAYSLQFGYVTGNYRSFFRLSLVYSRLSSVYSRLSRHQCTPDCHQCTPDCMQLVNDLFHGSCVPNDTLLPSASTLDGSTRYAHPLNHSTAGMPTSFICQEQ